MGAGQSTRDIPYYVYVNMNVNEEEYITVKLSVYDIGLRCKVRQFMRNKEDMERSNNPLPSPLSSPKDPREGKEVYINHHYSDFFREIYGKFSCNKNIRRTDRRKK